MDSSLYRFLLILFITHLIGNLARVICENIKNKSSSIASQQILTLERASPADTRRYIWIENVFFSKCWISVAVHHEGLLIAREVLGRKTESEKKKNLLRISISNKESKTIKKLPILILCAYIHKCNALMLAPGFSYWEGFWIYNSISSRCCAPWEGFRSCVPRYSFLATRS